MASSKRCVTSRSASPTAKSSVCSGRTARENHDHQNPHRLPAARRRHVIVNGLDVLEHTREVQAQIGYLPETAPLYPELSVQAYLKMMADLRQIPEDEQLPLLSEAIYATGLQEHLTRPIAHLSKGFRQRVGLAQAILHKPKLLILDEPTVGLDPTQIVEIRHLIRRSGRPQHGALLHAHPLRSGGPVRPRHHPDERRSQIRRAPLRTQRHIRRGAGARPGRCPASRRRCTGYSMSADVDQFQSVDGFPAYRVTGRTNAATDLGPAIYNLARDNDWPVRELRRDVRTLETVFNELATTVTPHDAGGGQ